MKCFSCCYDDDVRAPENVGAPMVRNPAGNLAVRTFSVFFLLLSPEAMGVRLHALRGSNLFERSFYALDDLHNHLNYPILFCTFLFVFPGSYVIFGHHGNLLCVICLNYYCCHLNIQ